MGGRGSRSGAAGTRSTAARTAVSPVDANLAKWVANPSVMLQMSDDDADAVLARAVELGDTKAAQNTTDTQRVFNALGWTERKPEVLSESEYEAARKSAGANSMYHTDAPYGSVKDASEFSKQYMNGAQFVSNGVHGDGTYWATGLGSSEDSWSYGGGDPQAAQIKGFLNQRARVVDQSALNKLTQQFKKSHPKTFKRLHDMNQDYAPKGGTTNGAQSIIAAFHGYNVIRFKWGGMAYNTLLDRSASTVSSTIRKFGDPDPYYNW